MLVTATAANAAIGARQVAPLLGPVHLRLAKASGTPAFGLARARA